MASAIQICNLALSHIGAFRISSFEESTKASRQCLELYPIARDSVLEDHDWGFARKEQTLALSTDTYSGWSYAYAYPSDCLAPRLIYDDNGALTGTSYDADLDVYKQVGKIEYEVRSNTTLDQVMLLTDKEDAILIYTAKVENPTMFSSSFVDAISWRLAADLAYPMNTDKKLSDQMNNKYLVSIGKSKQSSSNLDNKKPEEESKNNKEI